MYRVLYAALFAVLVSTGLSQTTASAKSTYLTPEGIARMMAVTGVKGQWIAARKICAEAGLKAGSDEFLYCLQEYQIHSLRALRARAKALTETVARQYGLCIDRRRFEISRCSEI